MKEAVLKVVSNEQIAKNIYEMTFFDENLAEIKCGQFANVKVQNRSDLILKRPFGITLIDRSKRLFTVCYQVVGDGTKSLTLIKKGDEVAVTYPLGNGFKLNDGHKKIMLVGGGVGVFPLLSVPTCHKAKYYSFLGFKDKASSVYVDNFKAVSEKTFVTSDDGSIGEKGFVTDLVKTYIDNIKPDIILACGPKQMFLSLKKATKDFPNIPVKVSLEERMGCGVGACLVCVCKIKNQSGDVHHKRVCADGPVFDLSEVEF